MKPAVDQLQVTGDVAHHRDPQQRLNVGVVRLRLQRIPPEDQQIDAAFGDPRAELLITTQRPLRKQVTGRLVTEGHRRVIP